MKTLRSQMLKIFFKTFFVRFIQPIRSEIISFKKFQFKHFNLHKNPADETPLK